MKAAVMMWRSTRMVVMTGVAAAIYASAQVILAPVSLPDIPGVLPFKVANIFVMPLGVLCGPAGAFGLGIGNTIGDYFTGSLGLGSVFGFLSSASIGFIAGAILPGRI